jgi:hypothetical protein
MPLTHRTIARRSRGMKEWVAILIVWQATPFDQPYEPEPAEIALCTERPDNEVCRELKGESNESR